MLMLWYFKLNRFPVTTVHPSLEWQQPAFIVRLISKWVMLSMLYLMILFAHGP